MKVRFLVLGLLSLSTAALADEIKEPERPRLVRQIGIDFKNVFTTKENLVTLGVGTVAAGGVSSFDQEVAHSGINAQINAENAVEEVFDGGRVLGGAAMQVGGAFATYGLGKLFHHQGVANLGRDLVRAQVVTQSLTLGMKFLVGRERPDASNQASFPSGHASGTFATATVLQRHYGWRIGIPAYVVAGYAATSRLTEGKHYLSDVVFGATVGILVGRTVTLEIAEARFAVSPTLPAGGVGIQLTWLGSSEDSFRSR